MAHGFVRATADLDLLIQRSRSAAWRSLLEGAGFKVFKEASSFLQFNPPPEAHLPVDLMLVADDGFEKMRAAAQPVEMSGLVVQVVSLLHLIALKCHAVQHSKSLRRLKDVEDLIHLIQINRIDLNEAEVRATILKHGNQEFYEKLRNARSSE